MFKIKFKYIHYFVLILIVIIALSLRFYKLDKSVWMQAGFDESRDTLVAKHIVENSEYISRGPFAAGGLESLLNSPIYYYFLAFLWFFTKNPTALLYSWALVMTIPILIGFLIGNKLKDKPTGLIIAGLFAVNLRFVFGAKEMSQPFLLLVFSTLFTLFALMFIKDKNNKLRNYLLSIFFLMLPLHFHYGILVAMPAGMIWMIYFFYQINKKPIKFNNKKVLLPILLFLLMAISWLSLTYKYFIFDQFSFLIANKNAGSSYSFSEQINSAISIVSKTIWGDFYPNELNIIFIFLTLFLRKKILKYKKVALFLFSFIFSVISFGLYKGYIYGSYILFLYPFFLIVISIIIRETFDKNKLLGISLGGLIFFSMFFQTKKQIIERLPAISYEGEHKEIAKIIYENYQSLEIKQDNNNQPKLLISLYSTRNDMVYDAWGNSGFWYYLEKNFNKNLVRNINDGVNLFPLELYPSVIYMICDHRVHSEFIESRCINYFAKAYFLSKDKIVNIHNGQIFSIWSASVDPERMNFNKINGELLGKKL